MKFIQKCFKKEQIPLEQNLDIQNFQTNFALFQKILGSLLFPQNDGNLYGMAAENRNSMHFYNYLPPPNNFTNQQNSGKFENPLKLINSFIGQQHLNKIIPSKNYSDNLASNSPSGKFFTFI